MSSLFFESENFEERWLLALLCKFVSMRSLRLQAIQTSYVTLRAAFEDKFADFNPKDHKWVLKIQAINWQEEYYKLQNDCAQNSVKIVTVFDSNFPAELTKLADQPLTLYFQGNLDLLQNTKEMITVVGSRNYSEYAKLVMQHILKPACKAGVGVVSGLAVGIDGLSHQIALENGAKTIGVIGSGLDDKSFYPSQHLGLKTQIIQANGLVISEYAPGINASKFSFPQRNRILAVLTGITWVVQAGEKSGTLITARLAEEIGKIVAITPGSILEKSMLGSLQLLKDGAQIIADSSDIFGLLGLGMHPEIHPEKTVEFNSVEEKKVYQKLTLSPRLVDDIAEDLEIEIYELSTHLTMLEIGGFAINVGQNLWVRGV